MQDGLQRQFFVVSYAPIFAWSTITVKDMALVSVLLGAISSRPVNKWLHELVVSQIFVKPGLNGLNAARPLRAVQTRNHLFMAGNGEHRPVLYGSLQTSLLSLYLRLRLQKGLRRQLLTCSHHGWQTRRKTRRYPSGNLSKSYRIDLTRINNNRGDWSPDITKGQ